MNKNIKYLIIAVLSAGFIFTVVPAFVANAVNNPVPTTVSIFPTSQPAGTAEFILTVNGTNFIKDSSVVNFNGSHRTTTYISTSKLTVVIPASDLIATGTFNITVSNPAPGGGISNIQAFYIVPTITSISPTFKTIGDLGFTLTVNGSNFIFTSAVQFASSSRNTYYSSTSKLTALFQLSDLTTAGIFNITVSNTSRSGTSNIKTFTVNNPVPTTTSISPISKIADGPQFTLTVNGTNFIKDSSVVNFNGSPRTTAYVSSTTITAIITAIDLAKEGGKTFSITVFNPTPGGGTSNAQIFTIKKSKGSACGDSGQGQCRPVSVGCGPYDDVVSSNSCISQDRVTFGKEEFAEQCCVPTHCSFNNTGIGKCKTGSCKSDSGEVGIYTSDCLSPKICCVYPTGIPGSRVNPDTTIISPGINPFTGEATGQGGSSGSAWAGLVPCQGVVKSGDATSGYTYRTDCTLCDFLKFLQNLITYFIELIFALAGGFIVWGAVEIMTSGGDETKIKEGKNRVTTAIYGIAIALAAWLFIGTVFQFLTNSPSKVPWNEINCSSTQ